jgi:hypothetical protein
MKSEERVHADEIVSVITLTDKDAEGSTDEDLLMAEDEDDNAVAAMLVSAICYLSRIFFGCGVEPGDKSFNMFVL